MSTAHCWFCGEPVLAGDYDYIGHRKVYVCGSRECVQETRDAQREDAQYRAEGDSYERYWS